MSDTIKVKYEFRFVTRCGGTTEMSRAEYDNWCEELEEKGYEDLDLTEDLLQQIAFGGRHGWLEDCEVELFTEVKED
jgi:hypothetical protein